MTPQQLLTTALAISAAALADDKQGRRLLVDQLDEEDLRGVVAQMADNFVLCVRIMAERDGVTVDAALTRLRRELARMHAKGGSS